MLGNLHNFGGRTRLHGDLCLLAENSFVKVREKGINVVGTGLFMEGIGQNPVYYDLAFEMLTRSDMVKPEAWIEKYIFRRYKNMSGAACEKTNDPAYKAWDILLKTVYAEGTNGVENSSVLCARPAVNVKKSGPNEGFKFSYDFRELAEAVKNLLAVESKTEGYQYDLVDLTRQYLSDYGYELYKKVAESFRRKNKEQFRTLSEQFLGLLADVDCLLARREEFSFEKWIKDARSCAENEYEKQLFEYNATALVTIWGEDEEAIIFDYSWREWSGLIGQYYKKRWEIFLHTLDEHIENDTEYIEEGLPLVHGRESWRANEIYSKMADWEVAWIHSEKTFMRMQEEKELHKHIYELMDKYLTNWSNVLE